MQTEEIIILWGEEPENGLELLKTFKLADEFEEYSNEIQMFVREGLIKSTCANWRANFHVPRGKKSQEYFVYFKIF